jgi:hypothetical protein
MSYTLKDALNDANPNNIADLLREVSFGTVLSALGGSNAVTAEALAVNASTHVHTLAYSPLLVQAVNVTVGTATGGCKVLPAGETPGSGEVAVNLAAGTLTFYASHTITTGKVEYVKQPSGLAALLAADFNA